MNKTSKPAPITPTSKAGGSTAEKDARLSAAAQSNFLIAVTNMSWQLAIVVLIPFVGGFKLDEHLHSSPLWTIVGSVLAIAGMVLVVWRQLQIVTPTVLTDKGARK
ncbi:MAG: AtpZ/AtpI family protein [Candidatus Saccharimonadales bacterium]